MNTILTRIFLIFAIGLLSIFPLSVYAQTPIPGSVNDAVASGESVTFPDDEEWYDPEAPIQLTNEFIRAKVLTIVQEFTDTGYGFGMQVFVQELTVQLLTGEDKGSIVTIFSEIPDEQQSVKRLKPGQTIILGKNIIDGQVEYYLNDIYRLNAMWLVLAIFVIVTLLLTGFQGIRAFIGLGFSFLVIGWYIVPNILDGGNPIIISLLGTAVIATLSLYIAHGFHTRTSIALASTMITISIAITLSYWFVRMTKLFGMGTEEAFYLQFAPGATINLQGLLLGGIIIGVLGILDDITTAQTAAVEQIHYANPDLDTKELYRRASIVGREHILALVNTLVLAYTGASLPLLLLFKIYERPAWVTLNSEIMMEEVIRMIIGSLALVVAVPITTAIAARYYSTRKPGIHGSPPEGAPHVHAH